MGGPLSLEKGDADVLTRVLTTATSGTSFTVRELLKPIGTGIRWSLQSGQKRLAQEKVFSLQKKCLQKHVDYGLG